MSLLKKILIALFALALIIAFASYYTIFHTSLPAKAIVGLFNSSPNIDISGIEGSISNGFSVEKMRFTDDQGNTNALVLLK